MGDVAGFLAQNDENFRRSRLPALYSDFRSQKSLNPDGFRANVTAWREALSRAAWEGRLSSSAAAADLLTVSVDEWLLRGLESKRYGRPLALGTVVKQAVSEKDFLPLNEFLRANESIYARTWAGLPKNVLLWALQRVWADDGTTGEDLLPEGKFVVLKNVETATKALIEHSSNATSLFDRVFTKHHFYKTFSRTLIQDRVLSERDTEVLLRYASRDKGVIAYDGNTVKFQDHIITEEDASLSSLKELIEDIKAQAALMANRIDELGNQAKEYVARKNRVSALALLKSRKMTEISLEKRYGTLNQLQQVADKIQQASDQIQLVKAMEASTGVLRSLNKQAGGVERVDQVVDSLREQMGEVDEVGNVLATAGSEDIPIDEAELDSELAELEALEKAVEREMGKAENDVKEAQRLKSQLDEIPKVAQTASGRDTENTGPGKTLEETTGEATRGIQRLSLEEPTVDS